MTLQICYTTFMYIKIKNPDRSALLVQIFTVGILVSCIFSFLLTFILISGDVGTVWKEAVDFFYLSKQEEGPLVTTGAVLAIAALPITLIVLLVQWFRKRKQWTHADIVRTLEFAQDGVILSTGKGNYFLPYADTQLTVDSRLVTVRTKNSQYAIINSLTLTFKQSEQFFKVCHKPNNDILYQLMDFHPKFKQLDFDFTLSEPHSTNQQELAEFVKEQLENQRLYGTHVRHKNHLVLILMSLLFSVGPLLFIVETEEVMFDFSWPMSWILLLFVLAVTAAGIWIGYKTVQDLRLAKRLKANRPN